MEIIYIVTALISSVAALAAWIAKILWSQQYAAAKDEIIKAKDAQISALKDQISFLEQCNSKKLREYVICVKEELEQYIDTLKLEIDEKQKELNKKDVKIKELSSMYSQNKDQIEKIMLERNNLKQKIQKLEGQLRRVEKSKNLQLEEDILNWLYDHGETKYI